MMSEQQLSPSDGPLVSVITPAYNAASYIAETIESVIAQSHKDWELLVVDDGSSDGTAQIISEYAAKDQRVRLIQSPGNEGAGPARNRALAAARGRYIAFLDGDDIWLPQKLERQLRFMQTSGAYFTFTAYEMVSEAADKSLRTIRVPCTKSYRDLLANTNIGCLTVMLDTRRTGRVSMPAIPVRQPLVLWLRLLRTYGEAQGLDEVLARYRVRPGSISRNKRRAALGVWRVYREYERLPLLEAVWFFAHYALRGVARNH
jgi:teichuronic acid biosynthesis glycosyltransferase TuaG